MSGVIASQAFTPNKQAGLKLELDPSDRGTIIDSGGNVSQETDKSKDGNHATQLTGSSQPLTEVDTINGKNVLTYDGDDDFLVGATASRAIPLSDHTLFLVCRMAAVLDERQCVLGWNDSTGLSQVEFNVEVICFEGGTGQLSLSSLMFNSPFRIIGGGQDFRGQPVIIAIVVDHDTNVKTYINGVLRTTFSIDNPIASVDRFHIAAELDLGNILGNYVDGVIGSIIIYDRILTNAEIDAHHHYLSNKYGLALGIAPFTFSTDFSSDFA